MASTMNKKAFGLLSGGLDSTLATKIMLDQGIEVVGLNFYTGFCITEHSQKVRRHDQKPRRNEALRAGGDLGVPVEMVDISGEYLVILENPKHGFGSAVNPCIDCRIMMFQRARERMAGEGVGFLFTGEVIGQRPMSQMRPTLSLIERESGCEGILLRPLSAKLLEPTLPEKEGIVDREKLYGFSGRSRKDQMALAEKLGIEDYPTPAGGCCFLTDKNYAKKYRDYIKHKGGQKLNMEDLMLLKVGRHLRLTHDFKIIVGRDEGENEYLSRQTRLASSTLFARDFVGPTTLTIGPTSDSNLRLAAEITASYADNQGNDDVVVSCVTESGEQQIHVQPAQRKEIDKWRI